MKSLNTIIKLHTRELDELRKAVVQYENEKEQLITYNNRMEEALEREHLIATNNPETGTMFANYRIFIRSKQDVIVKSLKDLDKKIATLQENIAFKFGEVKKYEILLASKITQQIKQENALETKELDAIAIGNYLENVNRESWAVEQEENKWLLSPQLTAHYFLGLNSFSHG